MIEVLIVEDDPMIAEAHRVYVGRIDGFRVAAVAHTARDAMRAASEAEQPIDLVLLDLGLPDASRISLASALRGLRPAPDVIAITSERDLAMVRSAVSHGALAYLLKPFTFAAFRDRMERYRLYRAALPEGTAAASQDEVDRALAELRTSTERDLTAKGQAAGTNDDIARDPGQFRRCHRRRDRGAGRLFASDSLALPRTSRRRRHDQTTHRLRQGRAAEDAVSVALETGSSQMRV